MSYTELNFDLTDEQVSLKENVHKFAVNVLRPASLKLDKMTPEEVIAEGSIYWDVMKKMYVNGYHTMFIPDEYGGPGLDPLSLHIVMEELAYGSVGFAISVGVASWSAFYASVMPEEYPIEKISRDARAGLIEDGSNDILALAAAGLIFDKE